MTLKTLPVFFFLALGAFAPLYSAAHAQSAPIASITVTQIRTQAGFVRAALYDEAGWERSSGADRAAAVEVAPVEGGAVVLRLTAPAAGRYAVRLFQDMDGDGQLNRNLLGLPAEPVGFSNNAPMAFGPPSFAAAAFDLPASGAAQNIALR